ncbi:hypothetical protein MT418_006214 [Batrachochytrium dendrobatidis]
MKSSIIFLTASSLCIMINAVPVDPNGDVSNVKKNDDLSDTVHSGINEQHSSEKPVGERSASSNSKLSRSQRRQIKKQQKKIEKQKKKKDLLLKKRKKMEEDLRKEEEKRRRKKLREEEKLRKKRQELEEKQRKRRMVIEQLPSTRAISQPVMHLPSTCYTQHTHFLFIKLALILK